MKSLPVIMLVIILLLALAPAAWTFSGWLAMTGYELVTATEVTESFWNWRHFGLGLLLSVIAGVFSR